MLELKLRLSREMPQGKTKCLICGNVVMWFTFQDLQGPQIYDTHSVSFRPPPRSLTETKFKLTVRAAIPLDITVLREDRLAAGHLLCGSNRKPLIRGP